MGHILSSEAWDMGYVVVPAQTHSRSLYQQTVDTQPWLALVLMLHVVESH